MKENTRVRILEEAFKLFCENTYEQVTVTDMERALKLTRGAIFYYVKNKEHLFREIIDKYLFGETSMLRLFEFDENISLIEFINKYVQWVENIKSEMFSLGITNMNMALFNITLYGIHHYQGYMKKAQTWQADETKAWESVLEKAIQSGEIKKDVDVKSITAFFQNVYQGTSFAGIAIPNGMDTDFLRKEFLMIYNLIKA